MERLASLLDSQPSYALLPCCSKSMWTIKHTTYGNKQLQELLKAYIEDAPAATSDFPRIWSRFSSPSHRQQCEECTASSILHSDRWGNPCLHYNGSLERVLQVSQDLDGAVAVASRHQFLRARHAMLR